jgi:hypothetical protein
MGGVRLDKDSLAWFAPLVQFTDGSQAFGMLDFPVLEERHDDQVCVVESGDTIESLAKRYYGSAELWVVLAVANDIEMPTVDLWVGRTLRVPDPVYVAEVWKPGKGAQ